jgi:hypothetical protein
MTGRAKIGGKGTEAGRRKGAKAKRVAKATSPSRSRSPTVNLQQQLDKQAHELAEARRQLSEALEQQTATSEVLNIISRSPTDAQPVFNAIAESAAHLCDAVFTVVWLYDGNLLHYAASYNFTPEVLDQINKSFPRRPDRSIAAGRAILDGKIAHVPDMLADPAYAHELALAGNWRASVAVPILRDGKPVGAISKRNPCRFPIGRYNC